MTTSRHNSRQDSETDGMLLLIILAIVFFLVTGGLAIEAMLLYLPLKRLTRGNPYKGIAVFGIAILVIGSLIFGYQIFAGDATFDYLNRTTPISWVPLGCGMAVYLLALSAAWRYESKRTRLHIYLDDLAQSGALSQADVDNVSVASRNVGIAPIDLKNMIYLETHVNALSVLEQGGMPQCKCPEGVFLPPDEICHASFSGMDLLADVVGMSYSTEGGTAYFRLSQSVTIAPSSYVTQSIPTRELRQQDSGRFLITSRRARFMGAINDIDFPFEAIEGLSEYTDGFQIHYSGRTGRQIFRTGKVDSRLASALIKKLSVSIGRGGTVLDAARLS